MTAYDLPGFYSRSLEGHRSAYLNFVIARFGGSRVGAQGVLNWKGPVLFLMVEENFSLYLFAALWRWLLGRRTVGLLFRPGPAVEAKTWRLRLKRSLLRGLRHIPLVKTLSIVPVPLNPRIGAIVDGWIHDFQLWDLSSDDHTRVAQMRRANVEDTAELSKAPSILAEARQHANGRPLLVALGMQNRGKGAERLAVSMREGGAEGWAVLVGGRFSPDASEARDTIEAHGGRVIDRFLSDDEMLALYAASDAVWCLYDPEYDQASGILGRAVQLGIPPVVRCGSFSAALCRTEGIAHATAEGGVDLAAALATLSTIEWRHQVSADLPARLALENDIQLRLALGLTTEQAG